MNVKIAVTNQMNGVSWIILLKLMPMARKHIRYFALSVGVTNIYDIMKTKEFWWEIGRGFVFAAFFIPLWWAFYCLPQLVQLYE